MIKNTRWWTLGLIMALLFLLPAPEIARAAGPWYVDPSGSDTNDCDTIGAPCETINGAIGKASAGDTIFVASGTYTGSGGFVADIDRNLTLSGGWDPTFSTQVGSATLDGGGTDLIVYIGVDMIVEIDRFIIQNGFNSNGGGIINWGNLTITDSTITQNLSGGGIWNTDIGTLTMDGCTISDNVSDGFSSSDGGGIKNNGTATIIDSTISGNFANDKGGGIYNSNAIVTLTNTTVSGNQADGGGGIFNFGTVYLNNSTLSGNQATVGGGGIWGDNGTIFTYLNNATITDNTAPTGGGIYDYGGGDVISRNSIIAGNSATSSGPDCDGTVDSIGYNLIGDTENCTFNNTTGDAQGIDSSLGSLDDHGGLTETHPLLLGSPAINGGNPSGCSGSEGPLTTDQRGFSRLGVCDIGAYEAQSLKSVSDDTAIPGESLSYEIAFQNPSGTTKPYTVTDTLPSGITYLNGSLSATSGTPNYSAGVITWSDSVIPDQAVTITFDVEVGAVMGEIVNEVDINDGTDNEMRSATVRIDAPVCTLTKYVSNPVLDLGTAGSWDDDGIWHPSVLLDGSTFKMWYAGNDDTYVNHIGLATSPDGYAWTKEGTNPILSPTETWEASGVSRPTVILDGSTYKMWYTGVDSPGVIQIGYATSPDGISWTKHPGNPVLSVGTVGSWEDEDVTGPSVLKDGSTYHMWYGGHDGSTFRIGHASSSDGITWVKDPANPVLDVGDVGEWDWLSVYSPDVVQVGDGFKMWYSGQALPEAWQTGFASSMDGTTWFRHGLQIPEGPPGTFDTLSADHPSVLVDGTKYRIWYSGIDDSFSYTIGYASGEVCTGGLYSIYLPLICRDYSPAPPCPPDYSDDFSDPSSGWFIYEDTDVKYGYTGGEYQIWVKNLDDGRWVTPGAKATDFTVAVSARRSSGTEGAYGILFGISPDWSELYEVSIDQNFYNIWRFDSGWTWLAGGISSDILTGTNWNRIKVERDGNDISVWINDQFQTTIVDSSFTGLRRIGLSAYSPLGSDHDARFDEFALYTASCGPIAADLTGIEWGEAEAHQGIAPPKPEDIE